MLSVFKNVGTYYGNGTVFVTDGTRIQKLSSHNFSATSMRGGDVDFWVTSGVIVALGCDCDLERAIRSLKNVVARIEESIARQNERRV